MTETLFDVQILGAGPCGLATALACAAHGKKVKLLERRPDFDHREPGARRFQAVILDITTLNNLAYLGVDIAGGEFYPMNYAVFKTSDDSETAHVNYHRMPTEFSAGPSGNLSDLANRREIVAMASIRHIEDQLWQRVLSHPQISTEFDVTVVAISEGDTIQVSCDNDDVHASSYLAIADGANSHISGGLKLLGIEKKTLADPVDIVAARYPHKARPGELTMREAFNEAQQHTACFALADEYIVCTNAPHQLAEGPGDSIDEHMSELAKKLKLQEPPLDPPEVIRQQLAIAETFRRGNTFVLGDAAFSGTAVIGVYLNKAICDAVAFAEQVHTGRSQRSSNQSASVYRQLILEERLVAAIYNQSVPVSDVPESMRYFFEGVTRSLFRLKAGRHPLLQTLVRNWIDLLTLANGGLAKQTHSISAVANLFDFNAELLRRLGGVLEPDDAQSRRTNHAVR